MNPKGPQTVPGPRQQRSGYHTLRPRAELLTRYQSTTVRNATDGIAHLRKYRLTTNMDSTTLDGAEIAYSLLNILDLPDVKVTQTAIDAVLSLYYILDTQYNPSTIIPTLIDTIPSLLTTAHTPIHEELTNINDAITKLQPHLLNPNQQMFETVHHLQCTTEETLEKIATIEATINKLENILKAPQRPILNTAPPRPQSPLSYSDTHDLCSHY